MSTTADSVAGRVIINAILASKLGTQLLIVAVPVALFQATGSVTAALGGSILQSFPLLLSPFIGLAIDRFDRMRLFMFSEGLQLVAVTTLALSIGSPGPVTYAALLVGSTMAVCSSLITSFVLIPTFVPRDRLQRTNAYFTGGSQVIAVVGLPLGGVVIGLAGARTTLLIDAATFLITIGVAAFAPRASLVRPRRALPVSALLEGWRYLRRDGVLLRLAMTLGLSNLGAGALNVIVVTRAHEWGWGPSVQGVAMGVGAIGAAVGAFYAGGRKQVTELRSGLLLTLAGAVAMLAFHGGPVLLVGFFVLSFGEGVLNVRSITFRQTRIPAELTGRANALIRTIILGAVPLSSGLQLAVTNHAPEAVFAIPVAGTLAALLTWLTAVPRAGSVRSPAEADRTAGLL